MTFAALSTPIARVTNPLGVGVFIGVFLGGMGVATGSSPIQVLEHIPEEDLQSFLRGAVEAPSVQVLRRVRKVSGLTWEELAQVLNVSRRTLHTWDAGGLIRPRNMKCLQELDQVLGALDRGNPVLMRWTLQRDLGGHTALELLAQGQVGAAVEKLKPLLAFHSQIPELPRDAYRRGLPRTGPALRPEEEPEIQVAQGRTLKPMRIIRARKA